MSRIKNLTGFFAFALLVLSLPTIASAQWGGNNNRRDRDDDSYGRDNRNNRDNRDNRGNNRNDNYGRDNRGNNRNDSYGGNNGGYSNYGLRDTVRRLKRDTKDFVNFVDNALDHSRYDGTDYEDRINELVKDLRSAADRLESRYDDRDMYRSQSEAQDVVNAANRLDRELRRVRLGYDIDSYWSNLQRQISDISNSYRNNGRGNNGRGSWRDIFRF